MFFDGRLMRLCYIPKIIITIIKLILLISQQLIHSFQLKLLMFHLLIRPFQLTLQNINPVNKPTNQLLHKLLNTFHLFRRQL